VTRHATPLLLATRRSAARARDVTCPYRLMPGAAITPPA
jgi:hypothetical protein